MYDTAKYLSRFARAWQWVKTQNLDKKTKNSYEKIVLAALNSDYIARVNKGFFLFGASISPINAFYRLRYWYSNILAFKDLLKKHKLLKKYRDDLIWVTFSNEMFAPDDKIYVGESWSDIVNVIGEHRLNIAFLFDDVRYIHNHLLGVRRWIELGVTSPKSNFKIDGIGYHHWTYYPGYTGGGGLFPEYLIYVLLWQEHSIKYLIN